MLHQSHMTRVLPAHLVMTSAQLLQGQYRRAHEVKLSTDALYESELAATHQAWELVVELRQNKLVSKQQGEQPDHRIGSAPGGMSLAARVGPHASAARPPCKTVLTAAFGVRRRRTPRHHTAGSSRPRLLSLR